MGRGLSEQDVLRLRLAGQGLAHSAISTGSPAALVPAAVRGAAGIQAQEVPAAALAIRARSTGLSEADIYRALEEERTIVRTWLMRGTLHVVPAEDLGLLVPLLGARALQASRSRLGTLDWDAAALDRGLAVLRGLLDSGPLERRQLADALARAGLPAEGQAPIHLIRYAGLRGLLCYGPVRDRTETFVSLKDWVDYRPEEPGDRSLGEFTRRYLRSFGPAAPEDFAAWSGLTRTTAKRAWRLLAPELTQVSAAGGNLWALGTGAAPSKGDEPVTRLLPRFDTYLLGYASRKRVIEARFATRLNAGGGIIRPAVLVEGRVRGTWRLEKRTRPANLTVEPFGALDAAALRGIDAEAGDVSRFLGIDVDLQIDPTP